MPLLGFGDAVFGKSNVKLRGKKPGLVDAMWKVLKQRERRGELVAVSVGERCTSQVGFSF